MVEQEASTNTIRFCIIKLVVAPLTIVSLPLNFGFTCTLHVFKSFELSCLRSSHGPALLQYSTVGDGYQEILLIEPKRRPGLRGG